MKFASATKAESSINIPGLVGGIGKVQPQIEGSVPADQREYCSDLENVNFLVNLLLDLLTPKSCFYEAGGGCDGVSPTAVPYHGSA